MADQKAGTPATIAIFAAIGSLFLTIMGNPIWGLIAAIVAVIMGIIGVVVSASPKIRGGLMSIMAIIFGLTDIGLAVLGIIGVIIF